VNEHITKLTAASVCWKGNDRPVDVFVESESSLLSSQKREKRDGESSPPPLRVLPLPVGFYRCSILVRSSVILETGSVSLSLSLSLSHTHTYHTQTRARARIFRRKSTISCVMSVRPHGTARFELGGLS